MLLYSESRLSPHEVDKAMDMLMSVANADAEQRVIEYVRWMQR